MFFVGNVMIDTLIRLLPKADSAKRLPRRGREAGHFALATLHRPSNVDDPANARGDHEGDVRGREASAGGVSRCTRARATGSTSSGSETPAVTVKLVEPMGYLEFLALERVASIVMTDSGGVQEETAYLGVPCLTLRPNTERPVTIESGTNRLVRSRAR